MPHCDLIRTRVRVRVNRRCRPWNQRRVRKRPDPLRLNGERKKEKKKRTTKGVPHMDVRMEAKGRKESVYRKDDEYAPHNGGAARKKNDTTSARREYAKQA